MTLEATNSDLRLQVIEPRLFSRRWRVRLLKRHDESIAFDRLYFVSQSKSMQLKSARLQKRILRSVLFQSLAAVTKVVSILALAGISGVALAQTTEPNNR